MTRTAAEGPARYSFLGVTDDVTECGLCGKVDLKRTIVLDADGETVYFGSDCGARMLGKPVREVEREARNAQRERDRQEQIRRNRAAAADHAAWSTWLTARTGKTEIIEALQVLGGFAKARAAYREEG